MRKPDRITDRGELRKIAREILSGKVSASTQAEYGRIEKRLNGQHWYAYAIENQLKCVTTIRAAWRRAAAIKILFELGRSEDNSLSATDRRYSRSIASALCEQLNEQIFYKKPTSPKKGKRDDLAEMPSDWRENILAVISDKYQYAYMIMAITGARPEEIRKGFKVRSLEDDTLEITLQGAKVSETTGGGQAWRRLVVDPRIVLPITGLSLHADITAQGGEVNFSPTKGGGFQKAISRAAKEKLGYDNISALNLRHAFTSDLKKSKTDGDAISLAMGHSSRKSKQHYGRWRAGKSGKSPLKFVEAAKALTGVERIPPWQVIIKTPDFDF
jgi:integrase